MDVCFRGRGQSLSSRLFYPSIACAESVLGFRQGSGGVAGRPRAAAAVRPPCGPSTLKILFACAQFELGDESGPSTTGVRGWQTPVQFPLTRRRSAGATLCMQSPKHPTLTLLGKGKEARHGSWRPISICRPSEHICSSLYDGWYPTQGRLVSRGPTGATVAAVLVPSSAQHMPPATRLTALSICTLKP